MLIDDFLPEFDVYERHQIVVNAPIEKIYRAALNLDMTRARLTRLLCKLRGLSMPANFSLKKLQYLRFTLLGEKEREEVVFGLVGKFWLPTGGLRKLSAEEFQTFRQSGYAKGVWNFSLKERADRSVLLSTETRVHCTDRWSRLLFRIYWAGIGTFSGLIRKELLSVLKHQAEQEG